jgi:hypothetical protein
MKIKQFLFAFAMLSLAIGFNSCKKNKDSAAEEFETTFELSGNQAIANNLTQDAEDVFLEIAQDNGIAGNFAPEPVNNVIPCATITITPATGFPKTIVIDFGTSCTHNGITRSGKINITLTDSVRKAGSIATMTFTNYFVNLYKVEGTYRWTNTSTATTRSWDRVTTGGKITAPDARYWLHEGSRSVTQTAGVGTPTPTDDIFSVYPGTHTVTNSSNVSRTCTILEALQRKVSCSNIDMGKIKVQGPNHYATIDFGYGTPCDNLASLSIDGRTPRTIVLR